MDDTTHPPIIPAESACVNCIDDGLCGDELCGHCVAVALAVDATTGTG